MTLAASGYATKKDLKASIGKPLGYSETSMFGPEYKRDGRFAEVTMVDGKIAKVS